jgi:pyrimidine operon attenuation protein/uracil phosphoribosyltransferase
MEPTVLLNEKAIERSISRITHEILEKNSGSKDLCLIGIRTRGVYLAKRIQEKVNSIEKRSPWAYLTSPCTGMISSS